MLGYPVTHHYDKHPFFVVHSDVLLSFLVLPRGLYVLARIGSLFYPSVVVVLSGKDHLFFVSFFVQQVVPDLRRLDLKAKAASKRFWDFRNWLSTPCAIQRKYGTRFKAGGD